KVEILASTPALQLVLRDDGLGAAHELSSYPLRHNFADTLRRYREHYHERIGGQASEHHGEGIASAHDIVRCKQPIDAADLVPDAQPRVLWLDTLDGQPLTDYRRDAATPLAFLRDGVAKRYAPGDATVTVSWHFRQLAGRRFSTTLNLAMPSCDGFLGRYVLADGQIPGGFGQALDLPEASRLRLEDGVLGGALQLEVSAPLSLRGRPHLCVSQSEAGFEKIMQAVELVLSWTIPDDDCDLHLHLTMESGAP
ncbi:MAG TPA: alpha-amylase/4-alpha-glucanotransferase domain-containing protein, partial [Pseudomonas sp.]|nr:alpha-amylase/4-alpha-glucanotransferase domain-containing protein [Pseudomonas sp.]